MDFDNLHNDQLQFFESILFKALGREVSVTEYQFLSGGCINNALRVDTPAGTFCIKYNEHSPEDMFACEARGLALLRSTNAIHIPEVIGYGRENQKAYLILEFVHSAPPGATYWTDFGLALARLHGETQAYFGLDHNNYVGSLRQSNEPADNWIDFFVEKRLQVQAGLALYNQALPRELFDKFTRLYAKLPDLLPAEKPALLHGDLWNGNVMTNRTGAAGRLLRQPGS
jgi:protein-ribulosamine 3-kinase